MRRIKLTQGKYAKVDNEDFSRLSQHKWCYADGYAVRNYGKTQIRMHRELLGAKKGELVDHINQDSLDNRKDNLRFCSPAENQQNRGKQSNNTSGLKGVYWYARKNKWMSAIGHKGKLNHLGYFDRPEDVHKAYVSAANKYHKEFACTT